MTSACRLFPLGHGVPENFNFWGEQRQWSHLAISGAVCSFATHLSNASAKVLLFKIETREIFHNRHLALIFLV